MYNMNDDSYTCDFCDFTEGWDQTDDVHGDMWGCEVCGATFCSKCLKDLVGEKEYYRLMQEEALIRCPDCVTKGIKTSLDLYKEN